MQVYDIDSHIDFTLQGFHDWLMLEPERVIDHKHWETCALGQYLQRCEGFVFKARWSHIDAVDHITDTGQLPETLRKQLNTADENGVFKTHGTLAKHINSHYLNNKV